MKIVAVDNYARETVADFLVADNIKSEALGKIMLEALQATCREGDHTWYQLKPDDYRLSRGMEDLI